MTNTRETVTRGKSHPVKCPARDPRINHCQTVCQNKNHSICAQARGIGKAFPPGVSANVGSTGPRGFLSHHPSLKTALLQRGLLQRLAKPTSFLPCLPVQLCVINRPSFPSCCSFSIREPSPPSPSSPVHLSFHHSLAAPSGRPGSHAGRHTFFAFSGGWSTHSSSDS